MYEYWLKCRNDACKTLECFDGKFSIMLLFTITCKSCSMAAYASELIERLRQHLSFTNMCQNIKERFNQENNGTSPPQTLCKAHYL